jgi:trehalose 6-phosphate phosphatase
LSAGWTKTFKSEKAPAPLPPGLLPDLIRRKPLLLCLDYDGTISEIVRDPAAARPVPGILETLAELAAHRERIAVAIVSGREVATLRKLFAVPDGIALSGTHGLEMAGFDGCEEIAAGARECAGELEKVRKWLYQNVPSGEGFAIEDKGLALTLHYRNAPSAIAREIKDAFAQFVADRTPQLALRSGKMAAEALPKSASKSLAVRTLCEHAGKDWAPIYFGDDVTDEDAFIELADRGISVLVGDQRPSAARYRVENPSEVAQVLKSLLAALVASPDDPVPR